MHYESTVTIDITDRLKMYWTSELTIISLNNYLSIPLKTD